MASSSWGLDQISQILPLDRESLQQMLDYTSTLSKEAAAHHLKDILGDSPKALEFISAYNSRRQAPTSSSNTDTGSSTAVPRSQPKKRGKAPLNRLPAPRKVENHGNTTGAYQKKDEEDYMATSRKPHIGYEPALANTLALSAKPEAVQRPKPTKASSHKPPPSASGPLISDLPNVRTTSRTTSRTSSPAPKTTKVNIAGGASMHGASTTLQDLDSAIRALEIQTNPSLTTASTSAENTSTRACTCNATRHALLSAAPNCINCGKIICVKEGIGPCTFCDNPLLSSAEVTSMIESLKQERGQERMLAYNNSTASSSHHQYRRTDMSSAPSRRSFTPPGSTSSSDSPQTQSSAVTATNYSPTCSTPKTTNPNEGAAKSLDLAKAHRDRLLNYQAENARRTRIHDEAADYDTPTTGLSQWSSPLERARQLKRQQKVLREQEWNAKPEYEKRRMVVSVDLVGGKVVKRMADIDHKAKKEVEQEDADEDTGKSENSSSGLISRGVQSNEVSAAGGGGTFSKNPLLGKLIRPVWKGKTPSITTASDVVGDLHADDADKENLSKHLHRQSLWRRVQDDNMDDNEAVILDGGAYGGQGQDQGRGQEGVGAGGGGSRESEK